MMPIFISSSESLMTHSAQAVPALLTRKLGGSHESGCVPAHTSSTRSVVVGIVHSAAVLSAAHSDLYIPRMLTRFGLLTLVLGLVACNSTEPGSGAVASVAIVSGDLQIGPANTELPTPLVVRVLDAERRPVRGQVVNFRVVAGNGSVFAGSGSSNEDGLVQERWTLGPVSSDTQRVEARAVHPATGEPIVFAEFRALATSPDGVPPSGQLLLISGLAGGLFEIIIGHEFPGPAYALAVQGFS
jgi:hypothetical protein